MSNEPTKPLPDFPHKFDIRDIQSASEDNIGFCVACGAERCYTEPDARGYECDDCEEPQVYGAEEIAMMGLVR